MRRLVSSLYFPSLNVYQLLRFLEPLTEQEQGIAAQIVHVVIAGNSVEIPRGLLNGQVEASQTMFPIYPVSICLNMLPRSVYFL